MMYWVFCALTITVLNSENILTSAYVTPTLRRSNQIGINAVMQNRQALLSLSQPSSSAETDIVTDTRSDISVGYFQSIRSRLGSRILPVIVSALVFGVCDIATPAPAHAAIKQRSEESRIVSAYVPALPSETSSAPEFKMKKIEINEKNENEKNENSVDLGPDSGITLTSADIPTSIEVLTSSVKTAEIEKPIVKVIVPQLTARELLKSSIEPKVVRLKDILFTIKLFPTYLDKQDYTSLRAGLRQQPAMDLRKTCKILKPFLPADKQTAFDESYQVMIDAVNEMDVLALKRFQGTGVPEKGQPDAAMISLLNNAIERLDNLVVLTSAVAAAI